MRQLGLAHSTLPRTVPPEPLFFGGGQERGVRSGTLAPHLCAAFGMASAIAAPELAADAERASTLRERFLETLRTSFPHVRVNCEGAPRRPHLCTFPRRGNQSGAHIVAIIPSGCLRLEIFGGLVGI